MKRFFLNLKINYIDGDIVNFSGDLKYQTSTWIYNNLIQDDELKTSTDQKYFTFSRLFINSYNVVKNKGIKIDKNDNETVLIISTSNYFIANKIEQSLASLSKNQRIANIFFDVISYKIDDTIIKSDSNCFMFSAIEPIVLDRKNEKGQKVFLNPKTNITEYISFMKRNILRKAKSNLTESDINIEILNDTIDSGNKFTVKNQNSIKGYKFDFMLYVKSDVDNIINTSYFSGFGSKNSQGYGMVELKNI
jgi:CRISPR-associated endoribonuclease Cas6